MATPSDRQALLALPLVHGEISATRRRAANARSRRISVPGGRSLVATPVFDTYWRFAYERQEVFHRRAAGDAPPWTHDQIIAAHRFTNVYRASDRVSQYLIRHVIYTGEQSVEEVFFRTILFKLFNRVGTWERLARAVGPLSWRSFRVAKLEAALDAMMGSGESVYSGAYIMPSPSFGAVRKHSNHLKLLEHMMKDGAPRKVATARSLSEVFSVLRSYRSLGDFLAFQLTIDLNYGPSIDFSEMDFVVAGPGARDGIRKCFAECGGLNDADLIRAVTDLAVPEFERLGLPFRDLWGRHPQLIDLQNVFCEVDKYARVAHPEFTGHSGRTRIKQKFVAADRPTPQWYPPKWKLDPTGPTTVVTSERYAPAPAVHWKRTPLTS